MTDFKQSLQRAVDDGVITPTQLDVLQPYFAQEKAQPVDDDNLLDGLDARRDEEQVTDVQESEAPRFIRGFHDILITIGVMIATAGLWSLTNGIVVLVGAWILAEILVARQRLALPAFVLTFIYVFAVGSIIEPIMDDFSKVNAVELTFLLTSVWFPIALLPFYWRFRVPVALSMMLVSLVAFGLALALYIVGTIINIENLFIRAPLIANIVGLIAAVVLFAIAMWFDLRDRMRVMRWSDVAFWLHLISAPLLLYGMLSLLLIEDNTQWWVRDASFSDSIIVFVCVLVMMLIGIIIDRRAFVTSGLLSLIYAATIIFENLTDYGAFTLGTALLVVGGIVLIFGVGWVYIRGLVLGLLPSHIVSKLPPAQA